MEIERRACKACKAPLAIVMGPNGKRIPLDERSLVYRIGTDMVGEPFAEPVPNAFVTHFQTCTAADRFSGKKRR